MKNILILLSNEGEITVPRIKETIGHSMSTLHENIKKLEDADLISTKMVYKLKKQKIIEPKILFATKNPKYKTKLKRFFQGLWVNSKKSEKSYT